MALDTYAGLQAAVLKHAARSGDAHLEAVLPDLVALCEGRVNFGAAGGLFQSPPLRTLDMETRVGTVLDEEYEDLPWDWMEMRSLKLLDRPVADLVYRTPQQFDREYPGNLGAGRPRIYTIVGRRLRFGPSPAGGGLSAEMTYYARVPALATSPTGTNWLLTKAPAVYLYGTLVELMPFIRSDERLAGWFALYAAAIGGLQAQDARAARSGDALTQRVDGGNPP